MPQESTNILQEMHTTRRNHAFKSRKDLILKEKLEAMKNAR